MIIRFGEYEVDTERQEIRRDGVEASVEPQVFELLCYLIDERARVVSKDEIIERVWGGRAISDTTLSSRVAAARRALGDSGAEQAVIRTYSRRGFRFVAPVRIGPAVDAAPDAEAAANGGVERRLVTVAFCDFVFAAAEDDPEALDARSRAIEAWAREAADAVGGARLERMSDGLQLLFGYPTPSDTSAERAVRTARAILARAQAGGRSGAATDLRIGVATGPALVNGSEDGRGPSVIGRVVIDARKLADAAEPGGLTIASQTRRLIGDAFGYRARATEAGPGAPLFGWDVLADRHDRDRFESLRSRRAGFVGRDDELEALRRHWRRAAAGEGRLVLLSGEAGIGKSRLLREFLDEIAAEARRTLRLHCAPARESSMLFPIRGAIQRVGRGHGAAERRLPGLRSLLSDSAPAVFGPEFRERALRTLERTTARLSADGPLVIAVEDAQWADPTSLELAARLVDAIENRSVLLIVTCRPTFRPPWADASFAGTLMLGPLSRAEGARMIDDIDAAGLVSTATRDVILDRSRGVPLIAEELTAAVLERSAEDAAAATRPDLAEAIVPESLASWILERVDGLGAERALLQSAAVIGEAFTLERLRAVVAETPLDRLEATLDRMVERSILDKRGVGADARYRFRHALLRDAVYATLTVEQARAAHRRVLDALDADAASEVRALHADRAGVFDRALALWLEAYERSAARGAYPEAAQQLEHAARLLESGAAAPSEPDQLLKIFGWLAFVWISAEGYLSKNAAAAARKGLALARRAPESGYRFTPRYADWTLRLASGPQDLALEKIRETLEAAVASGSKTHCFLSNAFAGYSSIITGRLSDADAQLEAAAALYRPERHDVVDKNYGHAPGADLSYRIGLLRALQARDAESEAALDAAWARRPAAIGAHSAVQLLMKLGMVAMLRRDARRLRETTEKISALSSGRRLLLARVVLAVHAAFLDVADGRDGGFEAFSAAMDSYEREIMPFEAALRWTAFADLLLRRGGADDARRAHAEARRLADATGEAVCAPELLRIQGLLCARDRRLAEAPRLLESARRGAGEMGAELWRRRAEADLAALSVG